MPSLRTLSYIATLAFAAFAAAAPAAPEARQVPDVVSSTSGVSNILNGLGLDLGDLKTRGGPVPGKGLGDVIQKCHDDVKPHCDKLASLAPSDITVDSITGPCKEISNIVIAATAEVKLYVGLPLDSVLTLGGKVIALVDLANLIVTLLSLVLGTLAGVLKLVVAAEVNVILPILTAVGILLGELVAAVLAIVDGLLVVLVGLICKLIPAIFRLKLDAFIAVLGL